MDGTPEGCSYVKIGGEDGVEEVWGAGGILLDLEPFFIFYFLARTCRLVRSGIRFYNPLPRLDHDQC